MKILLLFFVSALAFITAPLFAAGCREEGWHSVRDEFGDFTGEKWYVFPHIDGSVKQSSGKTSNAGLHIILNNTSSDVIFSIQDSTTYKYGADESYYDYVSENTVWKNSDCLLSIYGSGNIVVKIKYEDGSVKKYGATLINDELAGSGALKHLRIKNLYGDIVDKGKFTVSISNNSISYLFKNVELEQYKFYNFKFCLSQWMISYSEIDTYKVGDYFEFDFQFGTLEGYDDVGFKDKDSGTVFKCNFNSDYSVLNLVDIESGKKVILEKVQ